MAASMESAMTNKGQVTIPKAIREHLGLKARDRVKFFVHPDGTVVLLPKRPAKALRGMLKSRPGRPVSTDEMNEAIAAVVYTTTSRRGRRGGSQAGGAAASGREAVS